ncbi:MAG: hypothetical protein ACRCYY_14495 [Trueperaceae bacterium]
MADDLALARHYLGQRNYTKALETLSRAPTFTSEFWWLQARALFLLNRDQESKEAVLKGLNTTPQDTDLLYQLALSETNLCNYKEAQKILENLLSLHSENVLYLARYSLVLGYQNRYEQAEQALAKARQLEPTHWLVKQATMLLNYWQVEREQKGLIKQIKDRGRHLDRAQLTLQHAQDILRDDPENAFAHYISGKVLFKQGGRKKLLIATEHARTAAFLNTDEARYRELSRLTRYSLHPLFRVLPTLIHLPPWGRATVYVLLFSPFILFFIQFIFIGLNIPLTLPSDLIPIALRGCLASLVFLFYSGVAEHFVKKHAQNQRLTESPELYGFIIFLTVVLSGIFDSRWVLVILPFAVIRLNILKHKKRKKKP